MSNFEKSDPSDEDEFVVLSSTSAAENNKEKGNGNKGKHSGYNYGNDPEVSEYNTGHGASRVSASPYNTGRTRTPYSRPMEPKRRKTYREQSRDYNYGSTVTENSEDNIGGEEQVEQTKEAYYNNPSYNRGNSRVTAIARQQPVYNSPVRS